jgi:hypothetical protein
MSDDKKLENQKEQKTPKDKEDESSYGIALGMCFGIALGIMFGQFVLHNMIVGMCCGLSLGVGIGSVYDLSKSHKKADGAPAEQEPDNKQDSDGAPEEKQSESGEE